MAETRNRQDIEAHTAEAPQHKSRLKKIVAGAGLLVVGGLAAGGAHLMFRNDNMTDFNALREFTSAENQQARCDMQGAFDAQEQMRLHFEEQGGVPADQIPTVAEFVGLEEEQATALLEKELFAMDFDCEVPVASSQEATVGLAMVAGAVGMAVGAGAVAVAKRRD